jgi:hypothetical protein
MVMDTPVVTGAVHIAISQLKPTALCSITRFVQTRPAVSVIVQLLALLVADPLSNDKTAMPTNELFGGVKLPVVIDV